LSIADGTTQKKYKKLTNHKIHDYHPSEKVAYSFGVYVLVKIIKENIFGNKFKPKLYELSVMQKN
jgi:hypothetical protein